MQPRVKALILGALPCCLAADLPPAAITRTILPQADAPAPGSIVTLAKGDTVLAAKPGWLVAARLKQTIDAEVGGKHIRIDAGKILPAAAYQGNGPTGLPVGATVYCGQESDAARKVSGLFTAIAAKVSDDRSGILADPSLCLVDSDGGGRFDHVLFVRGTKPPVINPIPDTPYAAQPDFVAPGESYIRIVYKGATVGGGLRFQLIYRNHGIDEEFRTFNMPDDNGGLSKILPMSYLDPGPLPRQIQIAGAAFTILERDDARYIIKVRIDRPFERRPFGITVTRVMLLWF
ncbi:MAG: hypothetical protein V4610_05060 [Pseudomonadota bacterium]|jgi:hypothetical protein